MHIASRPRFSGALPPPDSCEQSRQYHCNDTEEALLPRNSCQQQVRIGFSPKCEHTNEPIPRTRGESHGNAGSHCSNSECAGNWWNNGTYCRQASAYDYCDHALRGESLCEASACISRYECRNSPRQPRQPESIAHPIHGHRTTDVAYHCGAPHAECGAIAARGNKSSECDDCVSRQRRKDIFGKRRQNNRAVEQRIRKRGQPVEQFTHGRPWPRRSPQGPLSGRSTLVLRWSCLSQKFHRCQYGVPTQGVRAWRCDMAGSWGAE